MITNDAGCTREIKFRTAITKAASSKKKALHTRKLDVNSRKKTTNC
jgi:hypothetical protein